VWVQRHHLEVGLGRQCGQRKLAARPALRPPLPPAGAAPHLWAYCSENLRMISRLFSSGAMSVAAGSRAGGEGLRSEGRQHRALLRKDKPQPQPSPTLAQTLSDRRPALGARKASPLAAESAPHCTAAAMAALLDSRCWWEPGG
jgi:hypothetical protein